MLDGAGVFDLAKYFKRYVKRRLSRFSSGAISFCRFIFSLWCGSGDVDFADFRAAPHYEKSAGGVEGLYALGGEVFGRCGGRIGGRAVD